MNEYTNFPYVTYPEMELLGHRVHTSLAFLGNIKLYVQFMCLVAVDMNSPNHNKNLVQDFNFC